MLIDSTELSACDWYIGVSSNPKPEYEIPIGPVVEFKVEKLTVDECLKRATRALRDAMGYLYLAGYHS